MNCKPGDLAVIVKTSALDPTWPIGRIVRCVSVVYDEIYPCWIVDPPVGDFPSVYDGVLRPIRDPGEDAKDETLSWLPVPSKEGVPA